MVLIMDLMMSADVDLLKAAKEVAAKFGINLLDSLLTAQPFMQFVCIANSLHWSVNLTMASAKMVINADAQVNAQVSHVLD